MLFIATTYLGRFNLEQQNEIIVFLCAYLFREADFPAGKNKYHVLMFFLICKLTVMMKTFHFTAHSQTSFSLGPLNLRRFCII